MKLLDYETQWSQLEQSRNPFAVVVMSHLKTKETKDDAIDRKAWKLRLVKRLYELGYSRSEVLNLFRFVDWVMILPKGLKRTVWKELKTYAEDRKMPYITSVEEIGYDRGLEQGERSIVLRLLTRRFRHLNDRTIASISTLSITQLESLSDALLDFSAIEDLTTWLETHAG